MPAADGDPETLERALAGSPEEMARVREELADVPIYLVRLADELGVDLEEAALDARFLL